MDSSLLWLIPALPLFGAIVNGALALAGAKDPHGPPRGIVATIAVLMPALSFALTLAAAAQLGGLGESAPALRQDLFTWFHGTGLDLAFGLTIDRLSARPDFQGLIYPGKSNLIQPAKNAPPVFLAAGYNDRPDISEGLAKVYLLFKQAGVPAELHLYAGAGHGFGVRESNQGPAAAWIVRFQEWLADRKFLTPAKG